MQTAILKTAAVMILLYSAFSGPSRRSLSTTFLPLMIISVLFTYWTKDGIDGIIFSASGIFAAAAGVLACHIVNYITAVEYLTAAAIGAIIGPIGTIFIVLIVFVMDTIQKVSGNETTRTKERFFRHFAESEEIIPCVDGRLRMTMAEMRWLLKTEKITSSPDGSDAGNDKIEESLQKIFPWGTKLALATLAILISGVFL